MSSYFTFAQRSEFWICRFVFWCCLRGISVWKVGPTSILHRTTESERGLMVGGIYNYLTIKNKHMNLSFLVKVLVQKFLLRNCLWQNHNTNIGRQISQIFISRKPVSVVITRFSSVWYSIFTLYFHTFQLFVVKFKSRNNTLIELATPKYGSANSKFGSGQMQNSYSLYTTWPG